MVSLIHTHTHIILSPQTHIHYKSKPCLKASGLGTKSLGIKGAGPHVLSVTLNLEPENITGWNLGTQTPSVDQCLS